jgi:hypothetical protein
MVLLVHFLYFCHRRRGLQHLSLRLYFKAQDSSLFSKHRLDYGEPLVRLNMTYRIYNEVSSFLQELQSNHVAVLGEKYLETY